MHNKGEIIDYMWQYSRYHGNMLGYCENIIEDENGQAALIYLLNITEIMLKSKINDYDSDFSSVIRKIKDSGYITNTEYEFLNNKFNGVRRIRNLLAHANLCKYNILFDEDALLYPLSENETCIILYNKISDILFNIIFKVWLEQEINLDAEIKNIKIIVKEISPEQLLSYKGVDYREISTWNDLDESTKFRIADNASDVRVISHILKNLLKEYI